MKTIFLAGPVILRTREEDPDGMAPIDHLGQPAKNRDGSAAKPFKIVETHLKRGANHVDDAVADHSYVKAHIMAAPRGAHDDFTIEQLETLLAEKRAAALAGKGGDKAPVKNNNDAPAVWPSDDEIRDMLPTDARKLLKDMGGNGNGVSNEKIVAATLEFKASQAKS